MRVRRPDVRRWTPALLLGLLAALPGLAPAADTLSALRAELEAALQAAGGSARYSVLAVSLDTGDTLFQAGAHDPLAPASNLKLLTTATALQHLGADYSFPTYLLATGPVESGVLHGDLVLYGTGDPGISDRFQESRTTVFEAFADSLVARGIHAVQGSIVGDGSFFTGALLAKGWDPRDLNDWFAAPSGALSFNENMVTMRVVPSEPGQAPDIRFIPENADVPILNLARTVSGRASRRIEIKRESPDRPIRFEGEIPKGGREVWRQMSVPDPALYAANVFRGVLVAKGIQVAGPPISLASPGDSRVTGHRLWAPGMRDQSPPQVLATHRSPPLREYLAVVNKKSHNLFADLTLKTLGRLEEGEGSFEAGARVVERFLSSTAHVDTAQIRILDGSGLSGLNRISAAHFVHLLDYMARSEMWEEYWASLPEAGNPKEMRRMYQSAAAGNLRAKTGTIEHVSALTGLVRTANGERILFSIMANDVRSTWAAKRVEDRIGARLASFERPFDALSVEETVHLAEATTPDSAVAEAGAVALAAGPPTASTEAENGLSADSVATTASAAPPAPPATPAASRPPTAARTHTVASGENLTVIARRYGVRVNALVAANDGLSPRRLMPGQKLTIPAGEEGEAAPAVQKDPERHRVVRGENLTEIARQYNISLNELLDANPGLNPNRLQIGQRIAIPASAERGS